MLSLFARYSNLSPRPFPALYLRPPKVKQYPYTKQPPQACHARHCNHNRQQQMGWLVSLRFYWLPRWMNHAEEQPSAYVATNSGLGHPVRVLPRN
ncbi:hypothetical protein B0I37DRAFT_213931 [Chaetomium sp. MPI-CAGE-AT-0009]|nr:hypothetical protein B0I37DRAFT_213931 [Chaetomium sp. MPI-CAGE-AT-0009]